MQHYPGTILSCKGYVFANNFDSSACIAILEILDTAESANVTLTDDDVQGAFCLVFF